MENFAGHVDENFRQFAVLAIGDITIGFARAALKAIEPLELVIPSISGPAWIAGMTEIRGEWILVVAPRALLVEDGEIPARTLAVVEDSQQRKLALLVECVIGFRDIFPLEVNLEPGHEWLIGTTNDQLHLLDLARLFENPDISPEALRRYFLAEPDDSVSEPATDVATGAGTELQTPHA